MSFSFCNIEQLLNFTYVVACPWAVVAAQLLERQPTNLEVVGSNLATFWIFFLLTTFRNLNISKCIRNQAAHGGEPLLKI